MTDLNKERELYMAAKARIEKEEFFCRDWDLWKACAELKQAEINELRAELEKAKAQAVPETHLLIPKEPNRKTIMAMACVCLGSVGSGPEFLTLKEAKDVYSALVEKESGAEG